MKRREWDRGEKRNLASLLVVYKVRFCLWQLVHGAIGFAEELRKLLQLWNSCCCCVIASHHLSPSTSSSSSIEVGSCSNKLCYVADPPSTS
jgi:hypothetical protein